MKEVEVKILEADKKDLINKILFMGGKKIFDGKIKTVMLTKKGQKGYILRLRKKGNKNFLTYKKHISKKKTKIREEIEVEIESFAKTQKIFESLGFKPEYTPEKKKGKLYIWRGAF